MPWAATSSGLTRKPRVSGVPALPTGEGASRALGPLSDSRCPSCRRPAQTAGSLTFLPVNSHPLCAGRAWLYLALNENSLESYLRLFQENLGLLHKYYVK